MRDNVTREHRRSSSTEKPTEPAYYYFYAKPSSFLPHSACKIGCAVLAEKGEFAGGISSAQCGFKSDASYPRTQIGEVLDVPRKKGKKWS